MNFKTGCFVLLGLTVVVACQARVATFRNMSPASQQDVIATLQNNRSAYDIHQCSGALIIEPSNDNISMELIGSGCRELTTDVGLNRGYIHAESGLRQIIGPDGQVLGYVSHNLRRTMVGVQIVDEKTVRIYVTNRYSGR
jgi:hypothetical protein